MSPDETADDEQLDDLAHELGDAGRLARIVSAHREQPDPVFATNLRDELTGPVSSPSRAARILRAPGPRPAAATPLVPAPATPLVPAPVLRPMLSSGPFPVAVATPPPVGQQSVPRALSGSEPPPGSATVKTVPTPTTGMLDSVDVDEASIKAFYKWAAKARAADRTTVVAHEETSFARGAPTLVKTAAVDSESASEAAGNNGRVTALKPKVRMYLAASHLPTKWILVGLVACLALAVAVYGGILLLSPDRGTATARDATFATLIRAGVRTELTSYQALQVDDEIQVGAGGHANLTIDDSHVRLAPAADVKLLKIDRAHVVLDQLAGEVYHRVNVPDGGDYIVNTGSVAWVAHGTAFDLDRSPRSGGNGDEVVALALVDGFDIEGAKIGPTLQLNQGMSVTVELSSAGIADGPPVTGAISTGELTQAWIVSNARLDMQLQLPMGVLAAEASPSPTTTAASMPTQSPS